MFLRRFIHMGRIVPELDPWIAEELKNGRHPKALPSRRNTGFIGLPAQLEYAAMFQLRRIADPKFRKEARELMSIIHGMKLPDDDHSLKVKRADIKTEMNLRSKINPDAEYDPTTFRTHEDMKVAQHELSRLIDGTVQDRRRDWHYYEYDEYASNLYMAVRLAPNYACLKTVMDEIHLNDPYFEPKSVLDFGSGMGTTIWAVNETWPGAVNEFMNIELSKEQQYLCESLLRGGKDSGELPSLVYSRQYLPVSNRVKYDMVVSAFSMLELPNAELRAHAIENLWHKTNDLLVLVERGNNGGFEIIDEARNLVLDLSGLDVTRKITPSFEAFLRPNCKSTDVHIVAPCPHEFACPRRSMSNKRQTNICRFRVNYEPLDIGQRDRVFAREDYSYVVLRKQKLADYPSSQGRYRWPRIVERRKRSRGLVMHRICCPNGNLAETAITKSKYGVEAYNVAKSCDWADLLPIKIKDEYISRSSCCDKKTQDDSDKNPE